MAKKVVTLDDLDDSKEAEETFLYLLDGEYWEIDLAADNAKKFRDAFSRYIKASRRVAAKDAARRIITNGSAYATNMSYGDYDPAVVRAWAQENGVEVSDRGRVPEHIVGMWRHATQSANSST